MDHKECLKIKKLILKISQDERSQIPPLSYSFVEIIVNPRYINQTLIEEIDNENPNIPLTDDLFFECVGGNVNYLAYNSFRKKITDWQDKLDELGVSADEQKKAKDNLARISKALLEPFHKRSRPPIANTEKEKWILYREYQELIQQIEPVLNEIKNKGQMYPGKTKEILNKRLPRLKEYLSHIGTHRSEKEIAKVILLEKHHDLSKRTLIKILKRSEMMEKKLQSSSTPTV